MPVGRYGWVAVAAMLLAGRSDSQLVAEGRDITTVDEAPVGGEIAIQVPADPRLDPRGLEIPELAGTMQALGSQLVDGSLPKALVDYSAHVNELFQRITIFENGLVAVTMRGSHSRLHKKVLLPPDAMDVYRRELSSSDLNAIDQRLLTTDRLADISRIRIHSPDGTFVERTFSSSIIVPRVVERQRQILQDLMRAIAQDREVTNSVTGYFPKAGDLLVADTQKTYEVVRVFNDGAMVELKCIGEPTRMFVAVKDMNQYFIGSRRRAN